MRGSTLSQTRHGDLARPTEDRFTEVAKVVLEVELSKQLRPPLTDQQRTQLVRDLCATSLSVAQIKERGESVKLKDTYGTIALSYWLTDLVGLRSEIDLLVAKEIARRKQAISDFEFNRDDIERVAYDDLMVTYNQEFYKQVRDAEEKMKARVEFARRHVVGLSYEQKVDILVDALKRGLLPSYDEAMVNNLHNRYMVLTVLPAIFDHAKRLKGSNV